MDVNAPTYSFVNLPAGQYILTVVDANGASRSTPMKEIFGPLAPLTMTTNVSEFGNYNISCPGADDATINLTVSGGGGASNQATYFYTWSTSNGSGLDPSAEDQSGLGPGTYTVIVKDINDCSITETFTITEAPALTYNLDSIKNITCNGDNDGEINITVSGGTGNYTFEWSTENGSGIVQGQEDQSGLGPGDYKLILRDGCNAFEYIYTISTPGVLEITLDEKVNILCHDDSTGKINITVTGGTAPYDYVWRDNFNNVYDRNVGNVFNDGDLSNIPAGIYDLTVTDANVVRYFMTIPESVELVIQAGAMGKGGDVFVLDMGDPVKIYDLAVKMIRLSGLQVLDEHNQDGDIEIKFTGLRPGEKLYEELLVGDNVTITDLSLIHI